MANEIKTDGPTIGERVVATVTEGVKQGLAGLVIGGAAGAALGGLVGYFAGDAIAGVAGNVGNGAAATLDNLNTGGALQAAVDGGPEQLSQFLNSAVESGSLSTQASEMIRSVFAQPDAPSVAIAIEKIKEATAALQANAGLAGAGVGAATAGTAGATVGAAIGAPKGAVEGLAYGNPTKWAERVAAKGTERGLENIMAKAMKEQQDFVAQIEAERNQKGATPPTLAV